jgi:hypothetical protein
LFEMKKTSSIVFCVLVLCSVLLVVTIGTVMAYNESYSFLEYTTVENAVTIDGAWTTGDEWHDGPVMQVGATENVGKFVYKLTSDLATQYLMQFDLEFADSTNDAGDRWQICIDGPESASATAPQATGYKIEVEGHTTLRVYKGTGTGWTETTTTAVTWKDGLGTSPHDPSTHYIGEIQFDKIVLAGEGSWASSAPGSSYGVGPYGVRVAMYDASSDTWAAWPPASSADNPSSWGVISDISMGAYPEVLTISVMLVLSTSAVVISLRYFRKPKKL